MTEGVRSDCYSNRVARVRLLRGFASAYSRPLATTKPLDDLVQRVSNIYVFNVDKNCGFEGLVNDPHIGLADRWRTQNSCMEDYTVGACAKPAS